MADEHLQWMSSKEASQYLGINQRTLYRLVDEGLVTARRLGHVIRYLRSDLDAFLENAKIQPGTLGHLYPETRKSEEA